MGVFLLVFVGFAVTLGLAFFVFKHKINKTELVVSLIISTTISFGVYEFGSYSKAQDTEIWNGQVMNKKRERVSCEHSYECNCTTSTDSKGNKTRTCETCYEHSHDYDWRVFTNVGNLHIKRIDRQGVKEPPRFSSVIIGEPASMEHSFQNYVKAANYSIFNPNPELAEKYKSVIPAYPRVHDYYRANRVFAIGVGVSDLQSWNEDLSKSLMVLGPKKQANVNIFIADGTKYTDDLFFGIQSAWYNGKKNDILVGLGIDPATKEVIWSRVAGWSGAEIFNVTLQQELAEMGNIDRTKVIKLIYDNTMEHFKRLEMKNFEYLKGEITPTDFFMVMGVIGIILINSLMSFMFAKYDLNFATMFSRRGRRRSRF